LAFGAAIYCRFESLEQLIQKAVQFVVQDSGFAGLVSLTELSTFFAPKVRL
jgi:hypothetical protein